MKDYSLEDYKKLKDLVSDIDLYRTKKIFIPEKLLGGNEQYYTLEEAMAVNVCLDIKEFKLENFSDIKELHDLIYSLSQNMCREVEEYNTILTKKIAEKFVILEYFVKEEN